MRIAADPRNGGCAGKFSVRFIQHDRGTRRRPKNPRNFGLGKKRSRRIVWIRDEHQPWPPAKGGERGRERKLHARIVAQSFNASAVDLGVIAIHGKRWLADQNARAGVNKRIEEDAERVIAAICKKQFLATDSEVAREPPGARLVFGVHRDLLGAERAQRAQRSSRAARGIFIEVEPDFPGPAFRRGFVCAAIENGLTEGQLHLHRRTSMAFA